MLMNDMDIKCTKQKEKRKKEKTKTTSPLDKEKLYITFSRNYVWILCTEVNLSSKDQHLNDFCFIL